METIRELLVSLGLSVEHAEWVEAIGLEHLLEKGAELLVEAVKEIPKAMVEAVMSTAELSHQLEQASERTGLSTDRLQELGYIGKLAGVSMEEMEVSIGHLSRTMAEARDGNEEAQKTFARLGVRVTDSNGKLRDANAVLLDVSDGLHRLPAGFERNSLAMASMGRSGRQMIGVLGQGREKIAALTDEFHELGGGINEDGVKQGAEFMQSLAKIGTFVESLVHTFAGPLIEALGPIVDSIIEWAKENGDLIRSKVLEFSQDLVVVLKKTLSMLVFIGKAVVTAAKAWKALAVILGGALAVALAANIAEIMVATSWYAALGVAAVVAAAEAALAWAAAALPFVLIAAAVAIIVLALQDIYTYLKGGHSILGEFIDRFKAFVGDFLAPQDEDPWWLVVLKEAVIMVEQLKKGLHELMAPNIGKIDIAAMRRDSPSAAPAWVGGANKLAGGLGGGAAWSPDWQGGSAQGGGGVVVTGDTHIEVHPPAGSSSEDIAGHVVKIINKQHGARVREAIGAVPR